MLLSGPARKKRPQASRKIQSRGINQYLLSRGGGSTEDFRRRLGGPEEVEDQSSGGPEEAARRRTRAAAGQRRWLDRRGEDQSTCRGPAGGWSSRLGGSDFSRRRGRTRPRGRGVAFGSSPALPLAGRSASPARSSLRALFLPRAHSFPRPFFRDFLPPRNGPLYGARHARLGANRTPNRRLPDAMVVRRTPYQSEASRPPSRPAYSALPIRRRQSDALKTLI